jgi:hypothetical protein
LRELIISAPGTSSRLNWNLLNNVVGTKIKMISGYKGAAESRLAMAPARFMASYAVAGDRADGRLPAEKRSPCCCKPVSIAIVNCRLHVIDLAKNTMIVS